LQVPIIITVTRISGARRQSTTRILLTPVWLQ
jgi:hypothetical protein